MAVSVLSGVKLDNEVNDKEIVSLRPLSFLDFVGQSKIKDNLHICIQSAIKRQEVMDHVLFYGPPGLGKTTLANIVANELGVNFRSTTGPVLSKAGDLAAILTNLQPNDVLFIDEIHRLNIAVEEILYSAMEDYKIDIIIGEGPSARTVKINLKPFTLIGATTRLGLISTPLRTRFGIPMHLDFYDTESLSKIVENAAKKMNIQTQPEGMLEIARRCRGTPRIAIRLLRRVRDFVLVHGDGDLITGDLARDALEKLEVDKNGLDKMDLTYLRMIYEYYRGGPVGIDTLAAALSEDKGTIEDTVEPYLLQIGLIAKTPRGRVLTAQGFDYLGVKPLQNAYNNQVDLID